MRLPILPPLDHIIDLLLPPLGRHLRRASGLQLKYLDVGRDPIYRMAEHLSEGREHVRKGRGAVEFEVGGYDG